MQRVVTVEFHLPMGWAGLLRWAAPHPTTQPHHRTGRRRAVEKKSGYRAVEKKADAVAVGDTCSSARGGWCSEVGWCRGPRHRGECCSVLDSLATAAVTMSLPSAAQPHRSHMSKPSAAIPYSWFFFGWHMSYDNVLIIHEL